MARKASPLSQAKQAMESPVTEYAPEVWHHWTRNPVTQEYVYQGVVSFVGHQSSGFYLTQEQHEAILMDDDTMVELR